MAGEESDDVTPAAPSVRRAVLVRFVVLLIGVCLVMAGVLVSRLDRFASSTMTGSTADEYNVVVVVTWTGLLMIAVTLVGLVRCYPRAYPDRRTPIAFGSSLFGSFKGGSRTVGASWGLEWVIVGVWYWLVGVPVGHRREAWYMLRRHKPDATGAADTSDSAQRHGTG